MLQRNRLFELDNGDGSAGQVGAYRAGGARGVPAELHWSIRPDAGDAPPLDGPGPNALRRDAEAPVLSQMNHLDAGQVYGWACVPGSTSKSATVRAYVDGHQVAEGRAAGALPFHVHVAELCQLPQDARPLAVGFNLSLPTLAPGLHELQLFASGDGQVWRAAFNMPAHFYESLEHPDAETALARKDAIILRRNAQLAQCWEERSALGSYRGQGPAGNETAGAKASSKRLVAAIAVNTVCAWGLG